MIDYEHRTLEMLREEDQLSRRLELALLVLIREMLVDKESEPITAAGASAFNSRAWPLLMNYAYSVASGLAWNTPGVPDLSELPDRLRQIIENEGDQLTKLIQDKTFGSDSDIYGREVTGDPADETWAESAAHIMTTSIRETVKEDLAGRLGLTHKRWLTKLDERVRPSHSRLEGTTVPAHQPFKVGKAMMMRPGDKTGPMSEWIGCRCSVLWFRPAQARPQLSS